MGLNRETTKFLLLSSLLVSSIFTPGCSNGFRASPAIILGGGRDALEDEEKVNDPDKSPPLSLETLAELAQFKEPDISAMSFTGLANKYSYIDPKHVVPEVLLMKTLAYYDANLSLLTNKNYVGITDYSYRSSLSRFFIIDMKTGQVSAIHVAHGSGSDSSAHDGYAVRFSNTIGSNESSLGFIRTAEVYQGKHGPSVRLDGLSSTNSRLRDRVIVIHSASYVHDSNTVQGRSSGCLAVSIANHDGVVARLKGGALIYNGLSK